MKTFKQYYEENLEIYSESKMLEKFLANLDSDQKKMIETKYATEIEQIKKKKLAVKAILEQMKKDVSGDAGKGSQSLSLLTKIVSPGFTKEDKETIESFLLGKQQMNLKVYDDFMKNNPKTKAAVTDVKPSELAGLYKSAETDVAKDGIIKKAIQIYKAMDKIEGWVYNDEPVFPVAGKRQSKKVAERVTNKQADIALEKTKKEKKKTNDTFREKVLYPAVSREAAEGIKVLSKTGREREIMKSELADISTITLKEAISKFWKNRSKGK